MDKGRDDKKKTCLLQQYLFLNWKPRVPLSQTIPLRHIALKTRMTSFVELVSNIHEINVKIQLLFSYGDFFAISITCFLRYKIHNHMASDHQTQTTSKQNLMERSLV